MPKTAKVTVRLTPADKRALAVTLAERDETAQGVLETAIMAYLAKYGRDTTQGQGD